MDRRDEKTWVAIELTHLGEVKVDDGTLEKSLREDLGVDSDFPIFIPATTYKKDDKSVTVHLMEGYIFVSSGLPETSYFALEQKPYVNQIMSSHSDPHGMRVLSTIPHRYIQDLQNRLQEAVSSDIEVMDDVRVQEGVFRSLTGRVLGIIGEEAHVQIELRSIHIIASIPLVFLESVDDES